MNKETFVLILVTTLSFVTLLAEVSIRLASFMFLFIFVAIMVLGTRYLKTENTKKTSKKYGFIGDETLFNNSLLILISAVLQADKKTSNVELKYVETALKIHFSEISVKKHMLFISKIIQNKIVLDIRLFRTINRNFALNEKIQLIHFLIGIVTTNGLLTKLELEVIQTIAKQIKLPVHSLYAILRMFNFLTEDDIKKNQKRRTERKNQSSSYKLNIAYNVLELTENSTVSQIKKAYRKLAKTHHPDRLVHLGEAHQELAKERFQKVLDAYEMIKTDKGFS